MPTVIPTGMNRVLVVTTITLLGANGCITSRGLVPQSGAGLHVTSEDGAIRARVKRVHLKWGHYPDQGPDQVVIEIENRSANKMRLLPKRVHVVELEKGTPLARGKMGLGLKGPDLAGGAIAGARLGSGLSRGGGGSGSLAGGIGGAVMGTALVLVAAIPVGIVMLGDHLARTVERDIAPGEKQLLRVSLGSIRIDDGHAYALALGSALKPRLKNPLGPLPLIDLQAPYGGYLPPSDLRWIWGARLGGGAIWEGPTTGGLGGVELFFGRQWKHLALTAFTMVGLGSAGLEIRHRLPIARWFTLIPFAGYGYTYVAGRFGGAVGHGPRFGMEFAFSPRHTSRMRHVHHGLSFGLYGHAGPIFIHEREGVGLKAQFGFVFGFF